VQHGLSPRCWTTGRCLSTSRPCGH
jgi:hypothetical protein